MKHHVLACAAAVSIASAGCVGFDHKSSVTSPTSTGIAALAGNWQSVSDAGSLIPSPTTCSDFKWNAVTQTATTASGSFSASCNGILYTGTAAGTLAGTNVGWSANGSATGTNLPVSPCAISLMGMAELGTDSIRVPYTGNTCLGPVSGVQILSRR